MDAALTDAAWAPPLEPGDPAPWFEAPTPTNPRFHFSTTVGRYILLGFLPGPGPERDAAFQAFQAHRARFDDDRLSAFLVLRDAESIAAARNQPPGLRWFLDGDGAVSRLYGALGEDGPGAALLAAARPGAPGRCRPADDGRNRGAVRRRIRRPSRGLADYAAAELVAPVLIVPRVFEPELCRRLIDLYEAGGGRPSGVMRDVSGRTVGVMDDFKRRRDLTLENPELRAELRARISRSLLPQIAQVFQFQVTRLERYIVACYDAEEGGYFRPHRDNETLGTAHRRFACSINLNAEDFEGGDLRFPEFGPRTYRPPTGGAVVFSCSLQHEATPVTARTTLRLSAVPLRRGRPGRCGTPTPGSSRRRAIRASRATTPLEVFRLSPPTPPQSPARDETMNRLLPLLAASALGAAVAGPAAAQKAISPGYWETTSKVTSPFPANKTERRCIKPADVAKFMEGKINHIYNCTYPTKDVGGGKIHLQGSCATKDGPPVPISGEGTFTSDSMHIDARISPQIGGLTIPVHASTDAHKLGDSCPDPSAPAG